MNILELYLKTLNKVINTKARARVWGYITIGLSLVIGFGTPEGDLFTFTSAAIILLVCGLLFVGLVFLSQGYRED